MVNEDERILEQRDKSSPSDLTQYAVLPHNVETAM